MRYFPINLDISGKKALVVGGGRVAFRKVKSLMSCGAVVTVVSPSFCAGLKSVKRIRRVKRHYRKTDLRSACLVISATDSEEVNRRVHTHAVEAGIPVNVVDRPDLCTFTVPAVVSRGRLLIGISTGGGSPALARWVRERIEKEIGPAFGLHLELLREMRPLVQAAPLNAQKRAALLKKMASDSLHQTIKKKGMPAARRLADAMLSEAVQQTKKVH